MSLLPVVRQSSSRQFLSRCTAKSIVSSRYSSSSSSSSSSAQTPSYLTDERKRALIALYHQSENFITPENLSKHIDNEFVIKAISSANYNRLEDDFNALKMTLKERRETPRFRSSADKFEMSDVAKVTYWNSWEAKRVKQVRAALSGRDAESQKVGLELVEEYRANLEQYKKAHRTDEAHGDSSL